MRRGAPILLLLLLPGCAARPPYTSPSDPGSSAPGYRALFRGEVTRGGERTRFRLAAAILPPDRVRLEFYGPTGGARAVVVVDPEGILALLPAERAYDRADSTPAHLSRILGLPLSGYRLAALLTGRPLCPPEDVRDRVATRQAAAFARTVAWHEIECPPGDILYQARGEERGRVSEATLRDAGGGAIILKVEYEGDGGAAGEGWPTRLRLSFEREDAEVRLAAEDGPFAAPVAESLFAPPVPAGFERRDLRISLSAPGLPDSAADKER